MNQKANITFPPIVQIDYKHEHTLLMGLLTKHRRELLGPLEEEYDASDAFLDLLHRYEIDATKRGIRP